jgi:phosphoesterase RecJ-like protein
VKTVINIDHHRHHNFFGDINLIHPGASSNSEQLFRIFDLAKVKINRREAAALYVGLVTDTGRFQQENTTPDSHAIAGKLMTAGIDHAAICRRIFNTRSVAALKLLSRALAALRAEAGGRVVVIPLARADFEETGAADDDVEEIVNFGLMVPGAEVSLFLKESAPGGPTKLSLRGKGKLDLSRLAVSLGGGGHRNASGAVIPSRLEEAEKIVLEKLAGELGS